MTLCPWRNLFLTKPGGSSLRAIAVSIDNETTRSAIRDFTQSLQRNPDQAEAYVNRGIDRYQMGYQQAALEDLLKGAECFCHQGQMVAYQKTLNLIKKLQQQSPSNEESAMA